MARPSRRSWAAVAGVFAVVVVLGGLWFASRRSISPEQRLAAAEPPPPAVVELELEERVLEDMVVVRGTVVAAESLAVMAPVAAGADDAGGGGASVVVDAPVAVGDVVNAGDAVAVISDRPVFVLPMPVPMHRTLVPGTTGPDVERFQSVLVAMGYEVPTDGEFGPVTQAAVRSLYEDRGFTPQQTGPELDDALAAATETRDAALAAVQDAQNALDAAGETAADPGALQRALSDAQSQLTTAEVGVAETSARVGVIAPMGELVGVRAFPVVVSDMPYGVGDIVAEDPVVVLSPSDFLIRAEVDPVRAALLTPGTTGVVDGDEPDEGWDVEVIETGAEGQGDRAGTEVMLRPTSPLDASMLGSSVRIDVVLAASDGPVLAAPVGALRSDADGDYLLVADEEPAGGTSRVGITPGPSIGGWVELVDPADPLAVGTRVRLG